MDWELTKENCVPVRTGRSKAALQELADPAAEALEAKRRCSIPQHSCSGPGVAWS